MSKYYNPYPENNCRCGTYEYEDYIDYENKFYHDKEFHVKRVERGKSMKNATILKIIADVVATGLLLAVCVGSAAGLIVKFSKGEDVYVNEAFLRSILSIVTGGLGYVGIREFIIKHFRELSEINADLNASKSMIDILQDKDDITTESNLIKER